MGSFRSRAVRNSVSPYSPRVQKTRRRLGLIRQTSTLRRSTRARARMKGRPGACRGGGLRYPFGERDALDPVGLQFREHVARKAADLFHEHLVRQYPAIETDLDVVGAGAVCCLDNALGHFTRR